MLNKQTKILYINGLHVQLGRLGHPQLFCCTSAASSSLSSTSRFGVKPLLILSLPSVILSRLFCLGSPLSSITTPCDCLFP